MNNKITFDARMITFLVLEALTLLAYFCFPWTAIRIPYLESFSSTAMMLPIQITKLISSTSNALSYVGGSGYMTMFCIYTYFFFLIPIFVVLAGYQLFSKSDQEGCIKYFQYGMVTNIVIAVIFIILRIILIAQIEIKAGISTLGNYITIESGLYVILICSLLGVVGPKLIQWMMGQGYQVPALFVEIVTGGKDYVATNNINLNKPAFFTRNIESTGNLLPMIEMNGAKQTIRIFNLPCTIGRNKQDVDYYVFDNTISRQHCSLAVSGENVVICDLNTTHGTFINGERMQPNEYYILYETDKVKMGDLEFGIEYNHAILNTVLQPVQAAPVYENDFSNVTYQEEPVVQPAQQYEEETVVLKVENTTNEGVKTTELNFDGGQTAFKPMLLEWINNPQGQNDVCVVTKTPFIIGKSAADVDYPITAAGVSRKHLSIQRLNDIYYVTDLNSTNGVELNRKIIAPGVETPLSVGDIISIGEREYRFEDA